ncbi:hypothetical protein R6Q59_002271 [Mikania micrantha]
MGGARKTTLARAIFDKISIHFEGKSFVENVRENSKAPLLGLKKLQEQVLTNVLKDKCISVSSLHEGTNLMKTMLCGKKVLVVLDDVDHVDQLEALAGDPSWFSLGSRIIITTRDEQVLIAHRVTLIKYVQLLSDEEAIRLFRRHAFREAFPTHEYEMRSLDQVVHYAARLPITIKVLGSHLCGKSKLEWADTLLRLKTIPLKETIMKLEISYDSLEDDYKEIFLDVACFLRNLKIHNAIAMLESCGYHARNEEMGKNIARREHEDEPHKHSRLWVHEEIKHVLANNLGNEATRCMRFENRDGIVLENLRYMKKLRCLIVQKDWKLYPDNIYEAHECFPNSLQYLRYLYYPHWCLPTTFEANNLVTIDMSLSKIKQLWNEGRVMKKLKFLSLGFTKLKSLNLGLMPNLERLNLGSCYGLVKLYVHDGCLKSLVCLNLSYCDKLRSLDLGMMPNLETLNLDGCYYLEKLDVYGGCLKSLVSLNLIGCRNLKSFCLSSSWKHLRFFILVGGQSNNSLLELHFFDLYDMEEGHPSIGNLNNLVSLCFSNCPRLEIYLGNGNDRSTQELEIGLKIRSEDIGMLYLSRTIIRHIHSICKLKHLKTLILHCCKVLERIYDDDDDMENLKKLDVSGCHDFRDIPSSICELEHLKDGYFRGCRRLEKLPDGRFAIFEINKH